MAAKACFWSGHEGPEGPSATGHSLDDIVLSFMPMTPMCMSPDLSSKPRLPSLTVYLTSPLACPIHISKATCSKLNSSSSLPDLFHSHQSPAQDGVAIFPVAQVNHFRVTLISFLFLVFRIQAIRKSCVLYVQNVPSILPLLTTTTVSTLAGAIIISHLDRAQAPNWSLRLHHCSLSSILRLVRYDPALQPMPSSQDSPPSETHCPSDEPIMPLLRRHLPKEDFHGHLT